MNVQEALTLAARRLEAHTDTPALDARVLLAHVTGQSAAWLLAHPEAEVTPEHAQAYEDALHRLALGEPLPYILGHWEFFGLDFEVTPDVLIPRPETELLVEKALRWLKKHPTRRRAVDVGTGSGCIAVALAAHIPDLSIVATDISPAALDVARRNIHKHGLSERIQTECCDLLPLDTRPLDLIVANLPYIPTDTLRSLDVYGREPTLALDGGPDGLDIIRDLMARAPRRLAPGGLMLLELEASQGIQAVALAYDTFSSASIHLHKDLAGHDRLLEIIKRGG
ncbi:MAG: peptide chain release factor N(5)-glutamine methyltransferase [Anaerolineales bacterium]